MKLNKDSVSKSNVSVLNRMFGKVISLFENYVNLHYEIHLLKLQNCCFVTHLEEEKQSIRCLFQSSNEVLIESINFLFTLFENVYNRYICVLCSINFEKTYYIVQEMFAYKSS